MNLKYDLSLPEWVVLDGQTHEGDFLNGRIIFQHIPSHSIIEFILQNDELNFEPDLIFREFMYKTLYGNEEKYILIVHFSLAGSVELDWLLSRAITFFSHYLDWQDASIILEETSKEN